MEDSLERVERLLALILIRDLTGLREKATQLSIAGFSNIEIADILQTSNTTIASVLYMSKKAKGKNKR